MDKEGSLSENIQNSKQPLVYFRESRLCLEEVQFKFGQLSNNNNFVLSRGGGGGVQVVWGGGNLQLQNNIQVIWEEFSLNKLPVLYMYGVYIMECRGRAV